MSPGGSKNERKKWKMCKILHAVRRAEERYGIEIGANTVVDIGKRIQKHQAVLVYRRSNTISVYDIEVEDAAGRMVMTRVVYSKTWKFPITFLPMPVGADVKGYRRGST